MPLAEEGVSGDSGTAVGDVGVSGSLRLGGVKMDASCFCRGITGLPTAAVVGSSTCERAVMSSAPKATHGLAGRTPGVTVPGAAAVVLWTCAEEGRGEVVAVAEAENTARTNDGRFSEKTRGKSAL